MDPMGPFLVLSPDLTAGFCLETWTVRADPNGSNLDRRGQWRQKKARTRRALVAWRGTWVTADADAQAPLCSQPWSGEMPR